MSVDKLIENLNLINEFDVKESYLSDYINALKRYQIEIEEVEKKKLPPVETIKLIKKLEQPKILDYCFDFKVIHEMLKNNGHDMKFNEIKKYLALKLK